MHYMTVCRYYFLTNRAWIGKCLFPATDCADNMLTANGVDWDVEECAEYCDAEYWL